MHRDPSVPEGVETSQMLDVCHRRQTLKYDIPFLVACMIVDGVEVFSIAETPLVALVILLAVDGEHQGVRVPVDPLCPGGLLATDGGAGHDRPPAVGLLISHDQRRVEKSAGGFEVESLIAVLTVVYYGRIRQRSPHRGQRPSVDGVVDDFVVIEQRDAIRASFTIHEHPEYP